MLIYLINSATLLSFILDAPPRPDSTRFDSWGGKRASKGINAARRVERMWGRELERDKIDWNTRVAVPEQKETALFSRYTVSMCIYIYLILILTFFFEKIISGNSVLSVSLQSRMDA